MRERQSPQVDDLEKAGVSNIATDQEANKATGKQPTTPENMHLYPNKKQETMRRRGLHFWNKLPTIQADEKLSDKQFPGEHAVDCAVHHSKCRLPWQKRKETSWPWMDECTCFELADDSGSDMFTRDSFSEFMTSGRVDAVQNAAGTFPEHGACIHAADWRIQLCTASSWAALAVRLSPVCCASGLVLSHACAVLVARLRHAKFK